jgi:prepilin-type N-terminal cleavage/methylation domain-containing protein
MARAFTLMELLVVIAVIAILVALGWPGLATSLHPGAGRISSREA